MLLRKLLFWLVWIPLSPFVWAMMGGLRTYNQAYVATKMSMVRLSAWQRFVEQKEAEQAATFRKKRRWG